MRATRLVAPVCLILALSSCSKPAEQERPLPSFARYQHLALQQIAQEEARTLQADLSPFGSMDQPGFHLRKQTAPCGTYHKGMLYIDCPTPAPVPPPVINPPPPTANFTAPTLVNPQNPMNYGAVCNGSTDDSTAFRNALAAGDLLVPAGKTCVINTKIQITVSNKHIECADPATTTLKQTVIPTTGDTHTNIFQFKDVSGTSITGDSVVNCRFLGTNTAAPQYTAADAYKEFNIPVETQNTVNNVFIAGNTFTQFWGQSMFQTFAAVNGGSGDQVIWNTFTSCGLYGPVMIAHTNGYIAHNTATDCAVGVENDNTTQNTGGNIFEFNTLNTIHGIGYTGISAVSNFLTGGAAAAANYSGNIVRNNSVSGVADGLGASPAGRPSSVYQQVNGGSPAQYNFNTCTNGCIFIF